MKIIYNNIIPFKGFECINLFGILFVRNGCKMDEVSINHEAIHTAQMKEMLYIPFYVWYFIEWLIEWFRYGTHAYHTNTFEREAYSNENNLAYLNEREPYSWWNYV